MDNQRFSLEFLSIWDLDIEVLMFFIGFFYCFPWIWRSALVLHRSYLGTECTTARYGVGSWAVITGGADGLGRAAVFKLAQKGFNIIIISNNEIKMQEIEQEILTKHPSTQIKIIFFDFGNCPNICSYEELYQKIEKYEISILMNNVCYADENRFQDISDHSVQSMMFVNCYSISILTKLVLQQFKSRWTNHGRRSLLINTCAGASIAPIPYVQVYAATKIFCEIMTEGLNYEFKEFGVDVLGIRNFGLTQIQNDVEALSLNWYQQFFVVTPEQCITSALSKCTSGLIFGAWQHEVTGTIIQNVMDLKPYEQRMLMSSTMGQKVVEDVKGIKL